MKTKSLTPKEARAYQERWRLVHDVELAELRRLTPDEALLLLSGLMTSAISLGWRETLEAEAAGGCPNWYRLRRTLGG